jgi:altered-inheritance-of-mitochondria protein 13
LKEKESEIEQEIQNALNKETLENKTVESDQIVDGKVRSSLSLQNDLDEIRQKVDRYQARREFAGVKEVEQKAQAVAECYKYAQSLSIHGVLSQRTSRTHTTTSLECWQEVEEFKASVAVIEKVVI